MPPRLPPPVPAYTPYAAADNRSSLQYLPSEIVSKEYHVENDEIPAPEISAVSGEYEFPISIEVLDDNDEVYYTTDGSDPV